MERFSCVFPSCPTPGGQCAARSDRDFVYRPAGDAVWSTDVLATLPCLPRPRKRCCGRRWFWPTAPQVMTLHYLYGAVSVWTAAVSI